ANSGGLFFCLELGDNYNLSNSQLPVTSAGRGAEPRAVNSDTDHEAKVVRPSEPLCRTCAHRRAQCDGPLLGASLLFLHQSTPAHIAGSLTRGGSRRMRQHVGRGMPGCRLERSEEHTSEL